MSLKTQIVSLRLRSDRQLIYLRSDFKSTLCNVIAKSLSPAVTNHFVTSYKSLNFVKKWFLTATEKFRIWDCFVPRSDKIKVGIPRRSRTISWPKIGVLTLSGSGSWQPWNVAKSSDCQSSTPLRPTTWKSCMKIQMYFNYLLNPYGVRVFFLMLITL